MNIITPKSRDEFSHGGYDGNEATVWGTLEIDTDEESVYFGQSGKYFHDNTIEYRSGRIIRFAIPNITLESAVDLINELATLCSDVINGRNGFDKLGNVIYSENAQDAINEIEHIIYDLEDEIQLMGADDYFQYGGYDQVLKDTTNEEISEISKKLYEEAISEKFDIVGIEGFLTEYRNSLIEAAENE